MNVNFTTPVDHLLIQGQSVYYSLFQKKNYSQQGSWLNSV